MSVKLVSINIEGSKHLEDKVIPYLKKENPDVITLQEVFEADVERIEEATRMTSYFIPMAHIAQENTPIPEGNDVWGILLLSKLPILKSGYDHYHRFNKDGSLPEFHSTKKPEEMDRVLGWIKVKTTQGEMLFATTHFMWSKFGLTTPLQLAAYSGMEKLMDKLEIDVFTGDFNAPRGREIFTLLTKRYKDNIPQDITTSIDNKIHKATNDIYLMVDGLFSGKEIEVSNVRVSSGVSDHKAISCLVEKTQ